MNIMRCFCRNSDFETRYLFISKEDPPTQESDTCLCLFSQKNLKYYSLSRQILFILPFKFSCISSVIDTLSFFPFKAAVTQT